MRHIDLFSGIGGFALASQWCWGDKYINVGHSEVEEFPCRVYHKHFPTSKCLGDITKIQWQEGQADLITGGFPCQPHSIAGKRKGSKDERDLWSECIRALCGVRPKYALFENVPALLISDNGRFFNRVLADLASIGYDAEWQIISACAVGAPHTRERLWIIAYPKGITWKRITVPYNSKSNSYQENLSKEWNNAGSLFGEDYLRSILSKKTARTSKSGICLVDDGIPETVVKLKSLGNAIVPQVALILLERIKQIESFKHKEKQQ